MNKLQIIQHKLKAPKGQYNSFGKYKYRSCEDILEAVKPILNEVGCTLTLSDDILLIGDRYYIRATATLRDSETGSVITLAYANAREDEEKKGMDGSQITGTASSYARKYALNGLFCIDDTKDADTDEYANQTAKKHTPAPTPQPTQTAKETLDPNHRHWNAVLKGLEQGKTSIAELQKKYIIPAASEALIARHLISNTPA